MLLIFTVFLVLFSWQVFEIKCREPAPPPLPDVSYRSQQGQVSNGSAVWFTVGNLNVNEVSIVFVSCVCWSVVSPWGCRHESSIWNTSSTVSPCWYTRSTCSDMPRLAGHWRSAAGRYVLYRNSVSSWFHVLFSPGHIAFQPCSKKVGRLRVALLFAYFWLVTCLWRGTGLHFWAVDVSKLPHFG